MARDYDHGFRPTYIFKGRAIGGSLKEWYFIMAVRKKSYRRFLLRRAPTWICAKWLTKKVMGALFLRDELDLNYDNVNGSRQFELVFSKTGLLVCLWQICNKYVTPIESELNDRPWCFSLQIWLLILQSKPPIVKVTKIQCNKYIVPIKRRHGR